MVFFQLRILVSTLVYLLITVPLRRYWLPVRVSGCLIGQVAPCWQLIRCCTRLVTSASESPPVALRFFRPISASRSVSSESHSASEPSMSAFGVIESESRLEEYYMTTRLLLGFFICSHHILGLIF